MARVFVVQEQHRFDKEAGTLVPRYPDLETHAKKFGEIRYLLSPSAAPWKTDSILHDLEKELADYGDSDSLLLIGNPILIGMTVAVAARINNGFVRMLQWSGKEKKYICISAQVFPASRIERKA